MLSDPLARAFGTDSVLATRFWSAVKTSTSKDMRDNWTTVMNYLHKTQTSRAPKAPAGVVQTPVQFVAAETKAADPAPLEAAHMEWFLQGTQQATFAIDLIATPA